MEPGGKDKVMKIGEARLEQNSDDIVGLIIKIGYYASKSDIDETLVVTEKLIEVGENIKSPAFSRRYATLLLSFKMMLLITPELEPEKLEFDPEKFARPVKFTMLEYIEACEEDGLF